MNFIADIPAVDCEPVTPNDFRRRYMSMGKHRLLNTAMQVLGPSHIGGGVDQRDLIGNVLTAGLHGSTTDVSEALDRMLNEMARRETRAAEIRRNGYV